MRRAGFRTCVAGLLGAAGFAGLSACTTIEGTNALTSFDTFEREVGQETLKGLGVIEREEKEMIHTARAPLVLPKSGTAVSVPTDEEDQSLLLPEDSDKVQIDASGLSEAELTQLRNIRVVDLRSVSGRPLTDAESQQLTARMVAARVRPESQRPLYIPPDEYFSTRGGQDLVCLAENGDLVTLEDPACPPEIRAALAPADG